MSIVDLPPHDGDGDLQVVIETPRGSHLKIAFDPERRAFAATHVLPRGVTYPFPWGFVPGTRAADGDPLDAMVYIDVPTWPGLVIPCRPIGIVAVRQREKQSSPWVANDRVIAISVDDDALEQVKDLPRSIVRDLERFFRRVGKISHADVRIDGWNGPKAAEDAIAKARKAVR